MGYCGLDSRGACAGVVFTSIGHRNICVKRSVGLDLQADGGTHVANTSEVGRVRVVGHESKGRINKRLRIRVDG